MAEPFLTISRAVALFLAPILILFPLVFAVLIPSRVASDSQRLQGRAMLMRLGLATAIVLALWLGLMLVGLWFPTANTIATLLWWMWFFPLWFLLAMPAVAAKNPSWGNLNLNETNPEGLRSASLVNRERLSPITGAMWWIPICVYLLFLGIIAARGLLSFTLVSHGSEQAIFVAPQYFNWALTLVVYGGVVGMLLVFLPRIIRSTLIEAEPMDAAGSVELAELYDRQRRKRILGLFWGIGTLLPVLIGTCSAGQLWFPDFDSLWGLIGGIGGTLIGIAGAIFGTWMSVDRAKIAELRTRLNAQ